MGFMDELKHQAREGLEAAKDKAEDLAGDARERFDRGEDTRPRTPSQQKVEAALNYEPGSETPGSAADSVGDVPEDAPPDNGTAPDGAPQPYTSNTMPVPATPGQDETADGAPETPSRTSSDRPGVGQPTDDSMGDVGGGRMS